MLFKSGGFNKYHPEMGNAFPYIQNTETLKVLHNNYRIQWLC